VVTGSEIYEGIVDDGFDDHVAQKAVDYGCEYLRKIIVPDDDRRIADAIIDLKNAGCEMIVTTGGLSVDPDDVTVSGVRRTGAEIIRYGSPVLPGAMFLYAVLGDTPILGLPACVFYHDVTLFNLVLPRILTGEILNADAIAEMGHGGLCLNCPQCRFPACPFGR
jgi:molybdopterin biosynthesis enzyme